MRSYRTAALSSCLVLALSTFALADNAITTGNGGGLQLGRNWGPLETYQGSTFRWVGNDAEFVVQRGGEVSVAIACEGGPSLGMRSFPLRILDASNRQVDHVECNGKDRRENLLLPAGRGNAHFVMHVDGGGKRIPNQNRILNFRVFTLDLSGATTGGGDVVDPRNGVRLGDHWYPTEHYKGQTFRWLDGNDGQIFVDANRDLNTQLKIVMEIGPSVGSAQTHIAVRDASGRTVMQQMVKGHQVLTVPVHLKSGENVFSVHVDTQNKPVPHDSRKLSLRIFSVAALR